MSFEVGEDSSIGSSRPQAPVVDAQDLRGRHVGKDCLTHEPKQTGAAGSVVADPNLASDPLDGTTTKRKANVFQLAA
jgi:hypothetical protein